MQEPVSVLLVEDDEDFRFTLITRLAKRNYQVSASATAEDGLAKFRNGSFDIVVSDIKLPGMNGVALLNEVRALNADMPFVLLTGYASLESAKEAVRLNASEYLLKPLDDIMQLTGAIERSVTKYRLKQENRRLNADLQKSVAELEELLHGTMLALAQAAEKRDPYTAGHQQRVSKLACALANVMQLSPVRIMTVRYSALLHDIGKIYVPDEILNKTGKLTPTEFELIKKHSQWGYEILQPIPFPWPVPEIVLQHHEKVNGSGYPRGIEGENLLEEAKILMVSDVVEAMACDRPYRPALGIDAALEEIFSKKGQLYDPAVAAACEELFFKRGFKLEGSCTGVTGVGM